MQLNMARIFPVVDETSARLMRLKAECLFRARVLTDVERAAVRRLAETYLNRAHRCRRGRRHSEAA